MQGAIYATDNAAYSWSAAVQETVDATLNRTVSSGISGASYYEGTFSTIQRSPAGDYVAVSSRGDAPCIWTFNSRILYCVSHPVTAREISVVRAAEQLIPNTSESKSKSVLDLDQRMSLREQIP